MIMINDQISHLLVDLMNWHVDEWKFDTWYPLVLGHPQFYYLFFFFLSFFLNIDDVVTYVKCQIFIRLHKLSLS